MTAERLKRTPLKRKTPLKRRSKTKRAKLIERCDTAWALNIKHRAGWKCEVCAKPSMLQAHHIRPRTYMRSRWERFNGVCLCWQHHKQFAHGDPVGFSEWLRGYALNRYVYATLPSTIKPIKRTDSELVAIAENLEADNRLYQAQAEAA